MPAASSCGRRSPARGRARSAPSTARARHCRPAPGARSGYARRCHRVHRRRYTRRGLPRPQAGMRPTMIMASTSSFADVRGRAAADDAAVLHHRQPVGEVEHVVDVVADQEDADALVRQFADQRADLARLLGAEGRGRLVHDQDAGVEVDRAARSRPPGAGRRRARLTTLRSEGRRSFIRPSIRRAACSIASSSRKPKRPVALATEEQVGDGVEIFGQRKVLVDRLDAEGLGVARRSDLRPAAVDADLAAVGGKTPERILISVDLPAPLWPSSPTTSPAPRSTLDVLDRVHAAEGLRDAAHLDERGASCPRCRR